jgi:hypothetical protein
MTRATSTPDPFPADDRAPSPETSESLEQLYYRLEGAQLRLLWLEQIGASRRMLERERRTVESLRETIQSRVRSIFLRRDLDERLLLEDCDFEHCSFDGPDPAAPEGLGSDSTQSTGASLAGTSLDGASMPGSDSAEPLVEAGAALSDDGIRWGVTWPGDDEATEPRRRVEAIPGDDLFERVIASRIRQILLGRSSPAAGLRTGVVPA